MASVAPQQRRSLLQAVVMAAFSAAFVTAGTPQSARAQDVLAVLSSESGHYREAFDGFQESFGSPVRSVVVRPEGVKLSGHEKLIVTFGGKAELATYQENIPSISCLALGTDLLPSRGKVSHVRVEMAVKPTLLLDKLKIVKPSLRRLTVFWSSNSMKAYIESLREAAKSRNIELTILQVDDGLLPDLLRSVIGKSDGLLLPPDPALVDDRNFTTMKDFSTDNHIPFFVPTESLVRLGGTASVSTSFKDIGKTVGVVAADIINGKPVDPSVYPEKVDVFINLQAAKKIGLDISPETLAKFTAVYP